MKTTPEHIRRALALACNPAAPVKGKGNDRVEFPFSMNNRLAKDLWNAIQDSHKYECRYGGVRRYISPEARDLSLAVSVVLLKQTMKGPATAEVTLALPVAPRIDRSAPVVVNRNNLALSKLNDAEIEEFIALVEGKCHPFEGRAVELKNRSGLTWGMVQR